MTKPKLNHAKPPEIHSLQIVRAVTAISIAAVHVNRITQIHLSRNLGFSFPAFWDWGIDLFFVLSGFVIFYVHNKDFGKPHRLRGYLIKRFVRIYPIYWLLTLLIIPALFIFKNMGAGYERDLSYIIKSFLLLPQTYSPLLFLGWTLIHIIRFYLIFGLLIWLKKSWGRVFTCIFILSTLFIFTIYPSKLNFLITNYLFSPFNIEFLIGCLGAYVMGLSSIRRKVYLIAVIFLYLILLSFNYSLIINMISDQQILLQSFNNPLMIKQRVWLLGIPFAIIITMLGIYEKKYSFTTPNLLLYLGKASYSIYLTHYLFIYTFIMLLLKTGGLSNSIYLPSIMLVVLLLSVSGGCLFYSIIETPMLSYLKNRVFTTHK